MARRVEIKQKDAESYYPFPVNPLAYLNLDSTDMNVNQTVDGYSYENIRNWDGRVRTMRWEGLPNKTPFSTLVSNLKALVGEECHIRLNYLAGGGIEETEELLIRVIDVRTEFEAGLGPKDSTSHLIYSSIEFLFVFISASE